ncbi:MAG: acetate kinase [Buchnera aphidicola (Pentalonia nigronervosa)]|jgi:acetate kinase|uniref:Acetate kinase n=1 Tax=Buchnera aphidicola (Pentalonia nigronervosa) TaxID=1309793 RepID=A0A7H1AZJ5_9GAMM|nr:MAG: acetate kinase [Buchnera aphidicola (Pentalonia nigronervosa)]
MFYLRKTIGEKILNNLILVLNCGSSSIKFAILNSKKEKKYLFGIVEQLFLSKTYVTWTCLGKKHKKNIGSYVCHKQALNFVFEIILSTRQDILKNLIGIGHRVVHGGLKIKKSVLVNDNIIKYIKDACCFAPLHNPVNLIGIQESIRQYPCLSKKNVAVFDTTFYQNMPKTAFLYAIPYRFYKDYNIRRYGAHGISHDYVSRKCAVILNKKIRHLNIITCHLGNGASISAIRNGLCVDTSMGLTPLEGLVMGTRSGDIDPAVIFFMNKQLNINITQIEEILTKKSGLLGLSGISSDFRYFEKHYFLDKKAKMSVDVFCYRLAKYIGSYSILMDNDLDALVFTGGIGENVPLVRTIVMSKLSLLNFNICETRNKSINFGLSGLITTDNSRPAFVISTDEELSIAQETLNIINNK